ncbi:MAG: DNA recombination protein RmuC [Candidatus Sumerlaeota bacterium]|nr:DNA recombination protein RmuC [Candidatus Sumerlaeota bacterium]
MVPIFLIAGQRWIVMDSLHVFLAFAVGLVVGAGVVWFAFRSHVARAVEQAKAEGEAHRAVLDERLGSKDRQIEELRGELQRQAATLEEIRAQLSAEVELRSAAQEKNARIPDLEAKLAEKERQVAGLQDANAHVRSQIAELTATLEKEREATQEKLALVEQAKTNLADAFKALSAEALQSNNQSFLQLARAALEKFQQGAQGDLEKRQQAIEEMVKPVRQTLDKFDLNVRRMEEAREGAYRELRQQVLTLQETGSQLRSETGNLVRALRSPVARGRWGEIQLRRVVEMAGMLNYCDFLEQQSVDAEDRRLRPDLIVKLPAGKTIVVDAKAPLEGYLEALQQTDDDGRRAKMADHARQVRQHVTKLGQKSYWSQFDPSPEFVVLFLPGENFFQAALESDPSLIEAGVEQQVLIATPTTLIALLRAVAYGWRQESLAENAKAISDLGRDLYGRICVFANHLLRLGKQLGGAIDAYNDAVGSLERNVLTGARRFKDLKAAPEGREVPELAPVDQATREIQAPELLPAQADFLTGPAVATEPAVEPLVASFEPEGLSPQGD